MTDIVIKRGIGKPDSLLEGELAIDTSTGRLYSLVGGVVTELNEPPEGVDLSDYMDTTKRNDVVEGSFQILWDDSADPTYPFNGRIGYNKAVADPNALDGSFLYVSGTRGTFSIGRDGDLELHGASELQGIPNNSDERPWITGFSYVQAADFLDADGNSIIGSGGGVELPAGTGPGSLLTWQGSDWTASDRFYFDNSQTNEIYVNQSGIYLSGTESDTRLTISFSGFEFTHGYAPARVLD